ncbi:cytochrome P450 [Amycolatopsis sp. H20-H5]|uniref:cytochrome P450 n=1 Tax=Amycolatopsis sp. H20-H5 TaxID=3046309 RepID=UPI002DB7A8F0|nr:cytochrome P450 [Amycolatopsis sp. H20-H5]MEC3976993.1 cytochrome P450 [Amycolatopsis sp. H20-H5]
MDFNMLDPDFAQDPYETMDVWRALGPVVYNSRHDQYMITSHHNCVRVLGDIRHFNSANVLPEMEKAFGGPTFLGMDGPRHQTVREIWAPGFERKAVEADWAARIQQIVNVYVDQFAERLRSGESLDALAEMTRIIPTIVTAQLLGVEEDVHKDFITWSDATAEVLGARLDSTPRGQEIFAEGAAAAAALNSHIGGLIEKYRALGVPDGTFVAQMVLDDFAPSMPDREIMANGAMFTVAANESTAQMMALALYALGRHPDQRRALVSDRSLVPAALEEVHRWMTLSQTVLRYACSDESQVEGFTIPEGSAVMALLGCANRDPARWDNPHSFNIFRPRKAHIGFGFGPHVCLGIHMARMEMRIWLNRLLDKLPEYEFAGDIEFGSNFTLRGLQGVPIKAA